MADVPDLVVFEGYKYRLSGNYYRRNVWGSKGPSNLHRAIWSSANGAIPKGYDIHHVDGDTLNNELSNLECICAKQHQREHALKRIADGTIPPISDLARARAALWHGSETGLEWHSKNSKKSWLNRTWSEVSCQNCGQPFRTPFPSRSKWCHLNCKIENLRKRRGEIVGVRPNGRKPRVLSGKRAVSQ